jgi:serine/threonine protein kinase/tetratricopeptide (TPR) repeat protein
MIGWTLGHYQIVEELGAGGMAVVYRATDTKLGRDVALKVLSPDRSVSEKDKARFLQEARAAAALHHPNICTIYDVGEDRGDLYIAMAFIAGRGVNDIVRQGPMNLDGALKIAVQVAEGLEAAHRLDIVHRDIKSANIIVDDSGNATIVDFGIAKLAARPTQAGEELFVGTVAYMSPEQAKGGSVDHRTDIWSLGVCLYEMIAGELPFHSEYDSAVIYQIVNQDPPSLVHRDPPVPADVAQIIRRALEKRPESRYQTVSDMLADLRGTLRDVGVGGDRREPSIAVLPFANMSDDRKQDYFCDGMAEEIINSLTQIEHLRVVARTSSFAFRDRILDIREIGRELGVDTLLEGSVQKAGNTLRITTQLVDVRSGYHLWSERFDRTLEDVFAIQDEIARNVVRALKVTLTENERRVIAKVPTTDVEAYDLYIRAMQRYHEMTSRELGYARNLLTSAIIRDPNYALAYCGLSDCYAMIWTFYDHDHSNIEHALTASRKALELDSELAQAHASYGLALSLDKRYDEAEKEFLAAIDLAPKLYEAYYFYARSCRPQGKLEKAAEMFEKASEVRPEDYQSPILAADTYRGLGRHDDVVRCFRKGLAAAEKHVEHHPGEARAWYLGAHAHYELGDRETAMKWNERAMELGPRDTATLYNAGCLFSLMGEFDKCFECLHRAVEFGFSNRAWVETDPDLQPIRSDPRYEPLLRRFPV